jgi:hypothetical protein
MYGGPSVVNPTARASSSCGIQLSAHLNKYFQQITALSGDGAGIDYPVPAEIAETLEFGRASPSAVPIAATTSFSCQLIGITVSCTTFRANVVRLQLHALAYNLANFLRTLALPGEVERWSLTSLREKVVKIGAKVVTHGRYLVFQMAEVAVPRELFRRILDRIAGLRPPVVARC